MRQGILIAVAVCLMLATAPAAFADEPTLFLSNGEWSVGLGGGFSNKDVGQYVLSGKYWGVSWEIGAEAFTAFKSKSDKYDQLLQSWVAYHYNLHPYVPNKVEDGPYIGIGLGDVWRADALDNSIGPIGVVGWDNDDWGAELKASWYKQTLISVVIYDNKLPE
jgi:hypothetical protein